MKMYIIPAILVVAAFAAWRLYQHGYDVAELENRTASAEIQRDSVIRVQRESKQARAELAEVRQSSSVKIAALQTRIDGLRPVPKPAPEGLPLCPANCRLR